MNIVVANAERISRNLSAGKSVSSVPGAVLQNLRNYSARSESSLAVNLLRAFRVPVKVALLRHAQVANFEALDHVGILEIVLCS